MPIRKHLHFRDKGGNIGGCFAPVRFLTPFPPQPSRPCGTPRVYSISLQDDLSHPQVCQLFVPCSHSPRARLRRVPSKVDSGRLNLPMSLKPSPNVISTSRKWRCLLPIQMCQTKSESLIFSMDGTSSGS